VGHGAIIHGCAIEDNCMIGMGTIVLDDAVIGEGSLIGAGALIPPNMKVPSKSLVVGMPGKIIREVTTEEYKMIKDRPQEYIELAAAYVNETT
jgi:carbonic anhydrase/acetyltransferase-like protein (isoleucine patch superfamily)